MERIGFQLSMSIGSANKFRMRFVLASTTAYSPTRLEQKEIMNKNKHEVHLTHVSERLNKTLIVYAIIDLFSRAITD